MKGVDEVFLLLLLFMASYDPSCVHLEALQVCRSVALLVDLLLGNANHAAFFARFDDIFFLASSVDRCTLMIGHDRLGLFTRPAESRS